MTTYKRTEPYTEIGIRRLPCFRCGSPARFQWQICADGNQYRPICTLCDVVLNALVLNWAGFPDADEKARVYAKEKGVTKAQLDAHIKRTAGVQGAEATTRLTQMLNLYEKAPSQTYLTPQGKAKIEEEIEHLKTYKLPRAEEKVKWAMEYGDGVDMHTTSAERDFYKKRLPMLEEIVSEAVIITPEARNNCAACLGEPLHNGHSCGREETRYVKVTDGHPAELHKKEAVLPRCCENALPDGGICPDCREIGGMLEKA